MRKATIMTMLVAVLAYTGCMAQEPSVYSKEYWHAMRDGTQARVTIQVLDESGRPVTNANARVFFRMSSGASAGTRVIGATDVEGRFAA